MREKGGGAFGAGCRRLSRGARGSGGVLGSVTAGWDEGTDTSGRPQASPWEWDEGTMTERWHLWLYVTVWCRYHLAQELWIF